MMTHLLNASGGEVARHEYLIDQSGQALVEGASRYYEGLCSGEDIKRLLADCYLSPAIEIDCNWKNTWILPPLIELFADARFLHLVRDPRVNVIACHNLDYYGQSASLPAEAGYEVMVQWLRALPRIRRSEWETLSPFARNCVFWVETHRLILAALSSQPERYLLRRLEDLSDDEAIRGIYRFFALPVASMEDVRRALATRVNTKVDEKKTIARTKSDILPRFDACDDETQGTLRRICGPIAAQLGYLI